MVIANYSEYFYFFKRSYLEVIFTKLLWKFYEYEMVHQLFLSNCLCVTFKTTFQEKNFILKVCFKSLCEGIRFVKTVESLITYECQTFLILYEAAMLFKLKEYR